MKGWGFYCLAAFGLTIVGSLLTFVLIRRPPEVGEIVASVLLLLSSIGIGAAILSKVVGFGNPAIPQERRGLKVAFGSLSTAMRVLLIAVAIYTIGVLATSRFVPVRKQLNSYYVAVPYKEGEKPSRKYVSDSGVPLKWERVSEEIAYRYKWKWLRTFLAFAAILNVACAGFFFSRSARQSPELKKQLESGMFNPQVDEAMRLNL